jgi:hypothetical protein
MKNPYKILNLSQDATNSEIVKAQIPALKSRKYSMKEITEAQSTLRKPSTRLAADFTFPILDTEKIEPVTSSIKSKSIDLDTIDENKYNSLT